MPRLTRALLLLFSALGLAACFDTPRPPCAFTCGPNVECPSGYTCYAADRVCHLIQGGAVVACQAGFTTDAPPADAPEPDAAEPDAAEPDAPEADAPEPDAPEPDAP